MAEGAPSDSDGAPVWVFSCSSNLLAAADPVVQPFLKFISLLAERGPTCADDPGYAVGSAEARIAPSRGEGPTASLREIQQCNGDTEPHTEW